MSVSAQQHHEDASYRLRPATVADVDIMARLNTTSFASNPVSHGMYGPTGMSASAQDKTRTSWAQDLCESQSSTSYIVAEDRATGRVIGEAKWHFHPLPTEDTEGQPSGDEPIARSLEEYFFGACRRLRQRYIRERPYSAITVLAVDASARGHGVGQALVRWGIQRADALGLDGWVTSTPMAWQTYRACGFEDIDVFDLDLAAYGIAKSHADANWGDGLDLSIDSPPLKDGYYRTVLMCRKVSGAE